MKGYSFYRKKITPIQMLWIVIKSWFTSPPLALGCLFILLFMPFYFLTVLLQILLFLPILPVIVLVYLPLSLNLYSKPEKNWLFWAGYYTTCAMLLSIAAALFFYHIAGTIFFLSAFTILSGLCGMSTYFNLYNSDTIEMRVENDNG